MGVRSSLEAQLKPPANAGGFNCVCSRENRTGKGENDSFHLLRKAHENPKVFVKEPAPGGRRVRFLSGGTHKNTHQRWVFLF